MPIKTGIFESSVGLARCSYKSGHVAGDILQQQIILAIAVEKRKLYVAVTCSGGMICCSNSYNKHVHTQDSEREHVPGIR